MGNEENALSPLVRSIALALSIGAAPAPAADAWKPVESQPAWVSVEKRATVGFVFPVFLVTYW